MSEPLEKTERSRVRRIPERGHYDRETANALLDAERVCHIAFVDDDGTPVMIPMAYGRDGDALLFHGSRQSRLMAAMADGRPLAVAVTALDGLVLARSLFHSSMNYRSLVAFGSAAAVTDEAEKRAALDVLSNHLVPGRVGDARGASDQELAATAVVRFPLREASVKIRTGPPKDAKYDLDLPHWAGVVPLVRSWGEPEAAPDLAAGIELPGYLGG